MQSAGEVQAGADVIDIFQVLALLPKREVRVMEELNKMANQIRRERMSDRDEYERDQQELQKAALEALQASRTRALTEDEAMTLAYSAGLANPFYKEIRHEQK